MAITIQTIETKEFKVIPSGYDPEEVDMFLDSIIDEFEDMEREIQQLRQAARKTAQTPAPAAPAPIYQQQDSSEAAKKLLANAQRVSDETMEEARTQADSIVADAKRQADGIVKDAQKEAGRLNDSLDTLRSAANDYRARFKRLVDDQLHLLNAETELFE